MIKLTTVMQAAKFRMWELYRQMLWFLHKQYARGLKEAERTYRALSTKVSV